LYYHILVYIVIINHNPDDSLPYDYIYCT